MQDEVQPGSVLEAKVRRIIQVVWSWRKFRPTLRLVFWSKFLKLYGHGTFFFLCSQLLAGHCGGAGLEGPRLGNADILRCCYNNNSTRADEGEHKLILRVRQNSLWTPQLSSVKKVSTCRSLNVPGYLIRHLHILRVPGARS